MQWNHWLAAGGLTFLIAVLALGWALYKA
jgi:hypothetical protein